MTTPRVSVIIPTRNRRCLLRRALTSVLAQREVEIEVLVIDEASEDGTAEFMQSLRDPRILLVRHETPQGVAAARNAGLWRAQAPWVAFLDDDDLWAPTKLALQLEAAAESGAAWVCVGAVIVDDALTIVAGKRPPSNGNVRELLTFNIVPGGGSGPMVLTARARSLGGFDTALSILADWDMWIRLFLATPPAVVPRPVVAYRRHTGSMSHVNNGFSRELDHIVVKHEEARRAWGIELQRDRWLRWAAAMHIRSGNRREAIQTYVHLASRYRDLKSVARAIVGGVFPAFIVECWRKTSLRQLPPGWWEDAEAWLAPIRTEEDYPGSWVPSFRSSPVRVSAV